MSNSSPKLLTIESLRGAVNPLILSFEKGKKLTVIYGENGTGKSTICDALDFIGTGNVGSLENRGLNKTNKYWASVGKQASDISVTLEHSNGRSVKATLSGTSVNVTPPDSRPIIEVLRRSSILALIEAQPGERYKAISRFIDVTGIEASEDALRRLVQEIERGRETAVATVLANKDAIDSHWNIAGKPNTTAIQWAISELKKDFSNLATEAVEIDSLCKRYERISAYPQRFLLASKKIEGAKQEVSNAQKIVDQLLKDAGNDVSDILGLLEAASRHFFKHPDLDSCPLCESKQNADGLSKRINEKLSIHSNLKKLQEAIANKQKKDRELEFAIRQLAELEDEASTEKEEFEGSAAKIKWPSDVKLPAAKIPDQFEKWSEWLTINNELLPGWKRNESERRDAGKFHQTLKNALDLYTKNVEIQKDLDALIPRLKKLLEVIENERRDYTDNVLSEIAKEVGRLYESVHPGEGLNKISLELDPKRRASLEIGASFSNLNGAPPQAYFSDSHLDTLGLCIFLALSSKEAADEKILVLDDVLASVDEPHVERLIQMLYDEAEKFKHCIITTHYRPWKQKLRWGWLKNGQCQFIELNQWTSTKGISLIRSIPDVERLRQLLAESPPDPQLVCAKAGVILEAALDFLTVLYECHVPRRTDAQYTLGDLLPALDKKLRAVLRVEHKNENPDGTISYVEKHLAPHLDELTRIAQTRNVFGCHFNSISFDLLDSDAVAFGSEVLALMNCLVDHEAGWPRNPKSGSYWSTSGDTRRLHPLRKPG